jgi:nucleotide-binding universal stress UspA family protein
MFNKILLPTDGSELSASAAHIAIELAVVHKAHLVVLSVYDPNLYLPMAEYAPGMIEEQQKRLEEIARGYIAIVKTQCAVAQVPCEGKIACDTTPYASIISVAKDTGCDLIVMASHGRRGINALLLGSETQKVLTHSKIPVLVVR